MEARIFLTILIALFAPGPVFPTQGALQPQPERNASPTFLERVVINSISREAAAFEVILALEALGEADFDERSLKILLEKSRDLLRHDGAAWLLWNAMQDFRGTLSGHVQWSLIMVTARILNDEDKGDAPFDVKKRCLKPGDFLREERRRGLLGSDVDLRYLDKYRDERCVNYVITCQAPGQSNMQIFLQKEVPARKITAEITLLLAAVTDGRLEVRSKDIVLRHKGQMKWELAPSSASH
jgi:hypothetical protein